MPVEVTAVTNQPSKRRSRPCTARQQLSSSITMPVWTGDVLDVWRDPDVTMGQGLVITTSSMTRPFTSIACSCIAPGPIWRSTSAPIVAVVTE